ncbi:DNA ligase 3 [Echinococcus granulosus]|uniref:DNA ligase n=1 Tax=Echinococcus granulosus TaxID=6210 RepID=W6U8T2_ECHGR|nr:DNA ligase 3 [Echinococcus granulosus]EUB57733.1 DNA ligase 3 [Echinococcus granulosus]
MASEVVDVTFEDFVELIGALAGCSGRKVRTSMISRFIRDGPNGTTAHFLIDFIDLGSLHKDTALVLKLLLPKSSPRIFNVQDKQLIKYCSDIFDTDKEAMLKDLEKGDVGMTLFTFFKKSAAVQPLKKSKVSLKQVDQWLDELSNASGDNDRTTILSKCTKSCTAEDFLVFIRLIKKDLRIDVGSKQVLDALGPQAYSAFQASQNLEAVVEKARVSLDNGKRRLRRQDLSVSIKLMTPVKPMLAEPGRSADAIISKISTLGGALVEIKYDGERVQVHKQGDRFVYYSRSLKPVHSSKVDHLKEYIPKAFPTAADLILDSEILLLDTNTQKPLPFGTLGVHKRKGFEDATVCLFVFDCLYINGRSLLLEPMYKRREILEQNMTVVPNRVLFSEKHEVKTKRDLNELLAHVFAEGLEGLVVKPKNSVYEPGKRHWIKIKKDYLGQGTMADSADLIVLGAYYGKGRKGGLMSVYLMGSYDPTTEKFCTVTKVGSGFKDDTLLRLQKQGQMIKISKDYSKVPKWLNVSRCLVPDFVVKDPKKSPVWEITGAEFSRAGSHTAGASATQEGISIRFPRITRQRPDKTWREATDVPRLEALLAASHTQPDWSRWLDIISRPSNQMASKDVLKWTLEGEDEDLKMKECAKKPCLKRIRDSYQFNYLRPLLEGFVIEVPKTLIDDASFYPLYRRMVACGAVVVGDGLRHSMMTATHAIVWPDETRSSPPSGNLIPLTVEWLDKSINENVLQPLPVKCL